MILDYNQNYYMNLTNNIVDMVETRLDLNALLLMSDIVLTESDDIYHYYSRQYRLLYRRFIYELE